jgi:hypothetical protein
MNSIKIFIVFSFCSGMLFAQQQDLNSTLQTDSVYRYLGINPVLNIDRETFELFTPYDFTLSTSDQLAEGDSSTLWLRTEFALSSHQNFGEDGKTNNHLLLPFYKQYIENSKFDPVKYALAIAQTAAVGYMAYRHIKKYGFFK